LEAREFTHLSHDPMSMMLEQFCQSEEWRAEDDVLDTSRKNDEFELVALGLAFE
jgi:hypothetical protein